MSSERLDELIALAALGELTEGEERELDLLLADDVAAQDELRSTLDVAATLHTLSAEPPSPALRDKVLAATADLAQIPPPPVAPSAALLADATDHSAPAPVVDLASRRRRRVMSFVAAAAAALVVVVGAAVIVSDDRGDPDPVAEILDAPDVREHSLTGELSGLRIFFSPSEQVLVVEGVGVRAPTGSNTFELWKVGADGAIPIGLFRPDDDGRVVQRFEGVDIDGFMLGVTEEPPGGSEQPTLPILASA